MLWYVIDMVVKIKILDFGFGEVNFFLLLLECNIWWVFICWLVSCKYLICEYCMICKIVIYFCNVFLGFYK